MRFYKLIIDEYRDFKKGDVIIDSSYHNELIRCADARRKTVFTKIGAHSGWLTDMKTIGAIEPLHKRELKRIIPHLLKTVREDALWDLKPVIPIFMCLECGKKGNPKYNGNPKPTKTEKCEMCGEVKPLIDKSKLGHLVFEGYKPW